MIQLPNDVISVGYKKVAPFKFEQIYTSKSAKFTGTELEFYIAGLGYKFDQVDSCTRRCSRVVSF